MVRRYYDGDDIDLLMEQDLDAKVEELFEEATKQIREEGICPAPQK